MLMKIWTGALLFLAWTSFCAWLVLVCREKDVHPLRDFATFFKKQTKAGRVIFGTFFVAMWMVASTKPGGDGGTNNVQNVANVEVLPITSTNVQLVANATLATGNIGPDNIAILATFTITSTNTPRTITAADFERGFVQTRTGTGEQFDFTPPPNAAIVSDWRAFGAATDWVYASVKCKV